MLIYKSKLKNWSSVSQIQNLLCPQNKILQKSIKILANNLNYLITGLKRKTLLKLTEERAKNNLRNSNYKFISLSFSQLIKQIFLTSKHYAYSRSKTAFKLRIDTIYLQVSLACQFIPCIQPIKKQFLGFDSPLKYMNKPLKQRTKIRINKRRQKWDKTFKQNEKYQNRQIETNLQIIGLLIFQLVQYNLGFVYTNIKSIRNEDELVERNFLFVFFVYLVD
ncbi:hypothetical protein TTHERM_000600549 (macronuclear) [Tetrahymena thermophila SB210]|uniref:Uncharacterized protein n=1 Tax=Tetrahymena thermophila (strain SB210) TaxID=312017 RepID=W7X7C0_TETTS|nr:hypothetical protein TTHERM_000600549 [Tetrahymena thermophila SB210]EWS73257.1 hypothetical protein TTHERM_000600549 [Tetrahymena thermophila SB210]|eukprot:XP_012654221.1 hypothetical protein TTHERM_000600549 [Tetrahymena thermophila SB210]